MGVVCLGKEARLQKPHKLSPGTTFELRRPGDAGSGAGLSSPQDHLILKVSMQPRGGFAFGLLTWQQKGKKTFLVFKPKVALALYKDLKYFGVKEVQVQVRVFRLQNRQRLSGQETSGNCRLMLVTYYFILVPF